MSTRIKKDFTFQAALHFEDRFIINLFELNIEMLVETDDEREQNIAVERLAYLLGGQIEDCIFVCEREKDAIAKYNAAGMKVCLLPEDPYDQIIGLVLLNKFNAVMEGRIVVTELEIGSKLSNLIKFIISSEEAEAEYPGKYWWNDSGCGFQSKSKKAKDKIVPLFSNDDWAEFDLTWKEK